MLSCLFPSCFSRPFEHELQILMYQLHPVNPGIPSKPIQEAKLISHLATNQPETIVQAVWKKSKQLKCQSQAKEVNIQELYPNSATLLGVNASDFNPLMLLRENNHNPTLAKILALLATSPKWIYRLFGDQFKTKQGTYFLIRICQEGGMVQVVIPAKIPVDQNNRPRYCQLHQQKYIWPIALQRALVQVLGSYRTLEDAQQDQLIDMLFMASPISYPIANELSLCQILADYLSKGECIMAQTSPQAKLGLQQATTYVITGVFIEPQRLVRLVDSSDTNWNGKANNEDNQFWASISPENRRKLGYDPKETNQFFMQEKDFKDNFMQYGSISGNLRYNLNFERFVFNSRESKLIQVDVNGGQTFIELRQRQEKVLRGTLVLTRLVIDSDGQKNYTYISSTSGLLNRLMMHFKHLDTAMYVLFVAIQTYDSKDKYPSFATLRIYSQGLITWRLTTFSSHPKFWQETWISHARRNKSKRQPIEREQLSWLCYHLLLKQCGFGYVVISLAAQAKNPLCLDFSEEQVAILSREFNKRRLVLDPKWQGKGKVSYKIRPGQLFYMGFRLQADYFPSSLALPDIRVYNVC